VGKKEILHTAVEAARLAGQVITDRYPDARRVTVKGYRDVVTDVDFAAESAILDLVHARFPDHAVISEEAGGNRFGRGYTWIVDPLDGTTNYSRGLPLFGVSIGVLEGDQPVVGVVHDPMRDLTFVAERGEGATLNDLPMRISGVGTLADSLIGLDWGHADEVRQQSLAYLGQVAPLCRTVRALGSATLGLAYVAAGWLDAYFNLALKPWDAAAGMLLISEAGGRCTTVDGKPFRVDFPGCLATNGLIHDAMLTAMATAVPY
jgi:myo-inositol-1(or 4)-monophosphatase